MEAKTNLSAQAEAIARHLMSNKQFNDKVSAAATKRDG